MDKNEVLKILETAKDKNGEVPMRLVRQAFEKLPEPCEDAVSRQAAIYAVLRSEALVRAYGYRYAADAVRELPAVQPETAKRIVGKSRDGMTLWYQCDMCNEPVDAQDNFCRGCGRRLTDG